MSQILLVMLDIFAAHILPIGLFWGFCGFVMICVGDYIKKRAYFPREDSAPVTSEQLRIAKILHLGLNIGGWVLLILALVLLWLGGYYDRILDLF